MPVTLTTSQLLTTGVEAEIAKNVVLARAVGSRSEFKQIIGRGTRHTAEGGREHAEPRNLVASMRAHGEAVMRLLGEIEALVAGVAP